jgi:chemotaxis protein methyltransferase CheR
MKDVDCIAFLQWALPRMQLSWPGFRKVRRSVCKRIDRRCRELRLHDLAEYCDHLETEPSERDVLRACCAISISRFHRDRAVFESLEHEVLPALATNAMERGDTKPECWSAGCASGEEAYTLSVLWRLRLAERYPQLDLRVLATDIDPTLLKRATAACYRASTLKELPLAWRDEAFDKSDNQFCLRAPFRAAVRFVREDICAALPEQRFDLILCRNVRIHVLLIRAADAPGAGARGPAATWRRARDRTARESAERRRRYRGMAECASSVPSCRPLRVSASFIG